MLLGLQHLRGCVSISVFSFRFPFPVSISFPFPAFSYAPYICSRVHDITKTHFHFTVWGANYWCKVTHRDSVNSSKSHIIYYRYLLSTYMCGIRILSATVWSQGGKQTVQFADNKIARDVSSLKTSSFLCSYCSPCSLCCLCFLLLFFLPCSPILSFFSFILVTEFHKVCTDFKELPAVDLPCC